MVVPQDTTEEVIRTRLAAYGGEIEFGSLTGLDTSGSRPVAQVQRADGRTDHVEADWVIGADGARSAVRRLAGIELLGTGNDVLFAIGDGPVAGDLDQHALVYGYSRSGALGIAPFGGGRYRLAISVPDWREEQGRRRSCSSGSSTSVPRGPASSASSTGPPSSGHGAGWPRPCARAGSSSRATPPMCSARPARRA